MRPTAARNRVAKLAVSEPEAALDLARRIKDPWFRCQALAQAARYGPEPSMLKVVDESLAAAWLSGDPYRTVAVGAWPLRALIERGHAGRVEVSLCKLVDHSGQIKNPLSRLEALFLLWQAAYPMGGDGRKRVQSEFVAACRTANSWKAGDRLAHAALILAAEEPKVARGLIDLLREGRIKRRTIRRLEAGQYEKPRPFFWTD